MLDPIVIARFAAKHKPFFYIVGPVPSLQDEQRVQSFENWLDGHYHHIGHLTTPTVTVDLYGPHCCTR